MELQNKAVLALLGAKGGPLKLASANLARLGSPYGGWWVPIEKIGDVNVSCLLLSAGLGFDVSFDQEMLNRGFYLVGLEPMQESFKYATKTLGSSQKINLMNVGLWSHSGEVEFVAPPNGSDRSWSITHRKMRHAKTSYRINVLSIDDIKQSLPSNIKWDYAILKMDIEGAEEYVLNEIMLNDHFFDFIAVEMDFLSLISFRDIVKRVTKLRSALEMMKRVNNAGYIFLGNENFNFYWRLKES